MKPTAGRLAVLLEEKYKTDCVFVLEYRLGQ